MEKAKSYEEYLELRKKYVSSHYIWKWSKNKETPDNWLSATPFKVFGIMLGWKVSVVQKGYENVFFTHPLS